MSPSNTEGVVWLDHETGVAPLAAWCEAHPGTRCHLWLGGGLTVPLVVDPGVPLRDETALRAYADRVFRHYGLHTSALATWQSGRWRGAVGLEGLDWAQLQSLARRHRVKITAARPTWAQALPQLPRRAGTSRLLVVEPTVSTLLTLHDGALSDVQVQWLAPEAAAALAPEAQLVRVDRSAARRIGAPVPDFSQAPLRHEAWPGWAVATAGVVALAVSLGGRGVAAPAIDAADGAAALERPADAAWTGARGHDWGRVWHAAESASDERLRWLSFQHDARSGEVRLVGLAPDVAAALAAADRLGRAPGVAQALLARSEAEDDRVRFELLARMGGGGVRD